MPELNYTLNYTGEQIDNRLSNANQTFTGVTNAAEMTLSGPLSFTSATAENRNLNSVNYATISYIDACKSLQMKPDANNGIKLKDSSNADVVTLTIGSDNKGYLWASGSISISDSNGSAEYKSNGIKTPSGTLSFPSKGGTIAITSNIPDITTKMDKASAIGTGSFSINRKDGSSVGTKSATLGTNNVASGAYSFASGSFRTASGTASHAEGTGSTVTFSSGTIFNTTAKAPVGTYSYGLLFSKAYASEHYVCALSGTLTKGSNSYDIVYYQSEDGTPDSAIIGSNVEIPTGSGYSITLNFAASGASSHSEGNNTSASANSAHAEGYGTVAGADYSHSEGLATIVMGKAAHTEGIETLASGQYSHAEGYKTIASGYESHVEGIKTIANHAAQHVFGRYNVADPSSASVTDLGTYIEIVGNGNYESSRSNARTLDWSGNEVLDGSLTVKSRSSTVTTTLSKDAIVRKTSGVIDASLAFNDATSGTILTTGDLGSTVARMTDVGTKLYLHSFTLTNVSYTCRPSLDTPTDSQGTFDSVTVKMITNESEFSVSTNYISCCLIISQGSLPAVTLARPATVTFAGAPQISCSFFTWARSSGQASIGYGFYDLSIRVMPSSITDTVTEL